MSKNKTKILILAGGKGKRMGGEKPKVLCEFQGKPMIIHLLENIGTKFRNEIGLVLGFGKDEVQKILGDNYFYYFQEELLGTGHAVLCAKDALEKEGIKKLLVLYGDHPFIRGESIKKLFELKNKSNSPLCMMTMQVEDFCDWRKLFVHWGRILRDDTGKIQAIREYRDCSLNEKRTREVNPGIYCFETAWLWTRLEKIKNNNSQKEYYLTDVVEMAMQEGFYIPTTFISSEECIGINSKEELEVVEIIIDKYRDRQ